MVDRRGEESLNKEALWRPLHGGVQWAGNLNEEATLETIVWWSAVGEKFIYISLMETIVWWSAEGRKFEQRSFMETIVW